MTAPTASPAWSVTQRNGMPSLICVMDGRLYDVNRDPLPDARLHRVVLRTLLQEAIERLDEKEDKGA